MTRTEAYGKIVELFRQAQRERETLEETILRHNMLWEILSELSNKEEK
jgi:hypothetical protein